MPDFDVKNAADQVTITLQGNTADVLAGGNGAMGALILRTSDGLQAFSIDATSGDLLAGGGGKMGTLIVRNDQGTNVASIDAASGDIVAGGGGKVGTLIVRNGQGTSVASMDAASGDIVAGGGGIVGTLLLRNGQGTNVVNIDAVTGGIFSGGAGQTGHLVLRNSAGTNVVNISAVTGDIASGGGGQAGTLLLRNVAGQDTAVINAEFADFLIGGNGQDGAIFLYPKAATAIGDLGQANIVISADTGDIILKNADCAEEFDVGDASDAPPGAVMVLDGKGHIRESQRPYDKKVVGVVSGAGGYRPAIVLDKDSSRDGRAPVALVGKVYCQVDVDASPIDVGDLLTTSSVPGHAMKATDSAMAFGAVLGKALEPLNAGRGLIPVLIALQ